MSVKYDCNKTLDCIHEYNRLCHDSHSSGCENDCPLSGYDNCCLEYLDAARIALIQKWSDEHPEKPKLTKKDHSFLNCFSPADKYIRRQYGILSIIWYDPMITIGAMEIPIDVTMFKCVEKGQKWSFEDLLKLEVEE